MTALKLFENKFSLSVFRLVALLTVVLQNKSWKFFHTYMLFSFQR